MVKTTKGGKVMNPTDAYRKELRKKELKRNKKERKKVREVGILKKDPEVIKEQIQKLEMMKADGALDKARKHKKRQLEDTLTLVLKKRKEYEEKMKENGEIPVMFSHLGPPPRRRTSAEEEERSKHPIPEDSVYYHPTLNPTGAPPPGKPPMYKSSIGPRIPLSADSLSAGASSSRTEAEDATMAIPSPPPPPPLPESASGDNSNIPASLPLPPPPPMLPRPAVPGLGASLPLPPPPPPPGPPPKDHITSHSMLPPPPPVHHPVQLLPPGTTESDKDKNISVVLDEPTSKETVQVQIVLPPPPPPPGISVNSAGIQSESLSDSNAKNPPVNVDDVRSILLPPPPPPPRPPVPGAALGPSLQPDVLPPGISRFPLPPPPPHLRPPLNAPGLPGQMASPPVVVPLIPRPPYGPPGPPAMMRPPLPPGPPPMFQDDAGSRPPVPQKPSYVKSAASTVVKRPLAQHNPELTSMVPASVRVRRETAAPKQKPKISLSTTGAFVKPAAPAIAKPEPAAPSASQKIQSIDDSYTAFLEDMKALGALDG